MKPGNAGGAKGGRFGRRGRGNMARLHAAGTSLHRARRGARTAQLHAGVGVSRVILRRPWRRACNAVRCARAVGHASAVGLGHSGDPIYPWGVGLTNFFVPGNRSPSPPPRPLVAASILFTVRRTLPIEYPAAPAGTRAANRGLRHERSLKGDNTNDRDAPKTRFGPA